MADTRATRSSTSAAAGTGAVSTAPTAAWLTPERVAHAEFRTAFRGLDATEVRAFLARVASELRSILEHEAELTTQLDKAEDRSTAVVAAPLDLHEVSALLGAETARVLETAREAAADIKARAESDAEATAEAAEAEASRRRDQAERVLGERTAEAERAAAEIRSLAEVEAAQLTLDAEQAADALREQAAREAEELVALAEANRVQSEADAEATREAARAEGRRMVAEARAVRERILTDMARRRNVARQQLERVRAGRERLLDAIEAVRQGVSEVQGDLSGSLVDAKLAGEKAARMVDIDTVPSLRELDAEVEMAKDTGLVDVEAYERRHEDLTTSALDTGEFAAVTAPEPDVTEPAHPLAVVAEPADEAEPRSEPAAAASVPEDGADDADADAEVAPSGDDAEDPDEVEVDDSLRFGNIQVVPLRIRPVADSTETDTDAPGIDTADPRPGVEAQASGSGAVDQEVEAEAQTVDRATADRSGAAAAEAGVEPATSGDAEVIDLRDRPGRDGGEPAEGGTGDGAAAAPSRRNGRRPKGAKKTGELFARLRAEDGAPGGAPDGGHRNGVRNGATSVIGGAVDVADAEQATGADGDGPDLAELDADRVVLHARDAALAPTVRDLNRQLKLVLSDQQNELLEASRERAPQEGIAIGSRADMLARYVGTSAVELAQAWALGRRSIVPDDAVEPDAAVVEARAAELAAAVVDALRQRLDLEPDHGPDLDAPAGPTATEDGADEPAASGPARVDLVPIERLRAAYREVRSQRLAGLVELHLLGAFGEGQLAAAPAGGEARWVSDSCGPDCLDNALAGPVAFGEAFPTGHVAPPAFPGCRCTLTRA